MKTYNSLIDEYNNSHDNVYIYVNFFKEYLHGSYVKL